MATNVTKWRHGMPGSQFIPRSIFLAESAPRQSYYYSIGPPRQVAWNGQIPFVLKPRPTMSVGWKTHCVPHFVWLSAFLSSNRGSISGYDRQRMRWYGFILTVPSERRSRYSSRVYVRTPSEPYTVDALETSLALLLGQQHLVYKCFIPLKIFKP